MTIRFWRRLSVRLQGGVAALGGLMIFLLGCGSDDGASKYAAKSTATGGPTADIVLTDVTKASRVTFHHDDGGSGKKYLVEAVSTGLALFDYDGDGLIDIYFGNGAPLPPRKPDASITNALYRNEGGLRFRDVTREAGVGDAGFGLGVAVGDFDSDGYPDLYVNNFGPNTLYRNNGDGTFEEVAERIGVSGGDLTGAGVCFLDADRDGLLDLYVANYADVKLGEHVLGRIDGVPSYPGPLSYTPLADILYMNNGDGSFSDRSLQSGIGSVAGTGMGIVCSDYDNDRDTDIFVVNDGVGNYLFRNDGSGRFEEVGSYLGLAYDFAGGPQANMGVDCGDFDNDGWLDFFTTSYSHESPVLYRNVSGKFFEDVTAVSGANAGLNPHVNWGLAFSDFDNDGDRDLFVAMGHLDQEIQRWDMNTAFRVRNVLLANDGTGRFVNMSNCSGSGLQPEESSRGLGVDDLDCDGDPDLVILNSRAEPTVLRNDTQNANHWIDIRLRGTNSNRDGVGSHVRVTAGGCSQLAEVHSGRGYQSHHGTTLHFGVGEAKGIERIEVQWLGGGIQVLENVSVDQLINIVEGK